MPHFIQVCIGREREERGDLGFPAEPPDPLTTGCGVDNETRLASHVRRFAAAADLRGALARHPAQTRQILRLMLGGEQQRWRCEPFDNAEGRGYKCTAPGDLPTLGSPRI